MKPCDKDCYLHEQATDASIFTWKNHFDFADPVACT